MKLEVGMYVRFKDKRGIEYIRKIVEIPKDNRYASLYLDKDANYSKGLSLKNVIKASYNIIDILEVGDYVNGDKVNEVVINEFSSYVILEGIGHYVEDLETVEAKDIETIVTKEQFEQMSYKVKESR